MQMPVIILASASPRRAQLLRNMGVESRTCVSNVPEVHSDQLTACEAAQVNAYRKARAVAKKFPDALVIGADTLVHLNEKLYGKPSDLAEAYSMLDELEGQTHHVTTAVCLLHLRERKQRIFCEDTAVTFLPLDAVKIRRYLSKVNPLDKAGAYAIQEGGELLVERISGSYTNVVGLPVEKLTAELQRWIGMLITPPLASPSRTHFYPLGRSHQHA